ncbi:MAG TPA: 1-(5-phosphoribosyl)-5-amino-4-imidazole-carboxylate carboxylase, partial [Verrucomicrobiales bacterium]|nr:1-(5-phosphoribosyl)-5-amino-4-imidazole-carboxylate carboxylase [Verrucomicrobiales bacterium]
MIPDEAAQLLDAFARGELTRDEVLHRFQTAPVADLGFASVDLHRELRQGCPEVIFGARKTPAQVVSIAQQIVKASGRVLATRITPAHAGPFRRKFRSAVYHEAARILTVGAREPSSDGGTIAVVCAGTSDLPVAEEAAVTAEFLGHRVLRISDVGVAGLHRLLRRLPEIQAARVVVVVAGMEAALP